MTEKLADLSFAHHPQQAELDRTAPKTRNDYPVHCWRGLFFQLVLADEVECAGVDFAAEFVESWPNAQPTHDAAKRIVKGVLEDPSDPRHRELCDKISDDCYEFGQMLAREGRDES